MSERDHTRIEELHAVHARDRCWAAAIAAAAAIVLVEVAVVVVGPTRTQQVSAWRRPW